METRPQEAWGAEHDALWRLVKAWGPDVSGEDKLAWEQISLLTRCGRERVLVTGAMMGAWQGRSSDAGLTRIKNLRAKGFIEAKQYNQQLGQWLVTLLDPRELGDARKVKIVWDGQMEFPFAHAESDGETTSVAALGRAVESGGATDIATPPDVLSFHRQQDAGRAVAFEPRPAALVPPTAEAPALPPLASVEAPALPRPGHLTLRDGNAHPHLPLKELRNLSGESPSLEMRANGGSAGGTSAAGGASTARPGTMAGEDEIALLAAHVAAQRAQLALGSERQTRRQDATVRPVGDALAARVAQSDQAATPAAKMARVDQLVGTIMQRVNCPNMARGRAVRIAWAIVEDELPAARLYECLESLHRVCSEKRLQGTRSQYFNASIGRYLPPKKAK